MLKWFLCFLFFIFYFFLFDSSAQNDSLRFCIAFYNVENLFDPAKDSVKNDESFTPTGFYRWTYKKFYKKLNDIAKVLLAINGWHPPDVIGLAEIENENVLRKLCFSTGLKNYHYHYIHYESPDLRGVDVALLYRRDRVQIVESEPIAVRFPFEPNSKNRDILYVKAVLLETDTFHLFVNHWTSRFSGQGATIPKRNYYAKLLHQKVDSLLAINIYAQIILMGDFNDYPTDESMSKILKAGYFDGKENLYSLYNLMIPLEKMNKNFGTHKSQEFWGCLDQFIVSKPLLTGSCGWIVENKKAAIFNDDFLLVPDEKFGGFKTFRTYLGPRYLGGYADHLPVKIVIGKCGN